MYEYLRTQAKEKLKITDLDYGKLVKDKSLEEVLKLAVHNYCKMSTQSESFHFIKSFIQHVLQIVWLPKLCVRKQKKCF